MQCFGIASGGDRCLLDAGYGTDHDRFCMHHTDQVVESLVINDRQIAVVGKNPSDIETDAGVIEVFTTVHVQFDNGVRMAVDLQPHSTGHPAEEVQQFFSGGDDGDATVDDVGGYGSGGYGDGGYGDGA